MSVSRFFANIPSGKALWGLLLPLLLSVALRAAGPDPSGIVLYLPLEDAKSPIDASANPTAVAVQGTLNSVEGRLGTRGLEFNGSNANRIQVTHADKLQGMSALTIEAWMLPRNVAGHEGMSIVSKRVANLNADQYNLFIWTGRLVNGRVNGNNTNIGLSKTVIADDTWYHVALVYDAQGPANEKIRLYVNGVLESSATHPAAAVGTGVSPLWVGDLDSARNFPWDGVLDEIGVWNIALTEAEVRQVMTQSKATMLKGGIASNPTPADGSQDVLNTTDLAWTPGEYAATHNVYLGLSWADVNAADPSVLVAEGLERDAASLDAGALEFGRTYYWRVDEVNAAPDNAVHAGDVWSFTVEPYAYPLTGVTATASSAQADMGPENTIDGSGLSPADEHSTDLKQMWMTTGQVEPDWIQYEFADAEKLHEMWVWNSNQMIEGVLGFGARNVDIEYSVDGQTWTTLENVPEFAQATGSPTYTANTIVSFGGAAAKYVKLTIAGNWGGAVPQTGLAEVRFFYIPVKAFEPVPAVATTVVEVDAELSWRPGREASSHKVYIGVDGNAVAEGAVVAETTTDCQLTPASLDFATTYYWKVDEVGDGGTYAGDVWSFTTEEYAVLDEFESYNDDDNRIYNAWVDGVTTQASGSQVGYDESPFAEKTIVHGGAQSMPLMYDNTASPYYSEAERTFETPRNLTVHGAQNLSLYYRGVSPSFVQTASGGILMNGVGTDIWGTSDQFRFAYKSLSGNGSIVARVNSLFNSNAWAKAGVMIRQSTDAGSVHAFMAKTAVDGNGASFQRRLTAGGASTNNDVPTAVPAPYWVKLDRTGDKFSAFISPDGSAWTQLGEPQTIPMTGSVLIGLAVCSHDAAIVTSAEFSDIQTTGNVTGDWQIAAIGAEQPEGNSPEPIYVTIKDSSGKSATVIHSDTATTGRTGWRQWQIPLSEFTSAGVKMTAVDSIVIGVGNRTSPSAGGTGILYIDDVAYGRPLGQ